MNLARAAGGVPAAPATNIYLPRGSAFAAAGVLAALNAQADQIIADLTWQPPLVALLNLGGVSAIVWAAMAAAMKISGEKPRPLQSRLDVVILTIVIVMSFIPVSYFAPAGLLLCAIYMLGSGSRGFDPEHRAALVLLALTGPLIWGRLLLGLFQAPVLALDAHLVGAAIRSNVQGNVVRFPDGSGQFIIENPCSSVHNISLAILLWTTAAMLFNTRFDRRYLLVGVAAAAFMFVLNIVRLSIMGLFPTYFDLLHEGSGAVLFSWAGLIGAVLVIGLGTVDAAARQK